MDVDDADGVYIYNGNDFLSCFYDGNGQHPGLAEIELNAMGTYIFGNEWLLRVVERPESNDDGLCSIKVVMQNTKYKLVGTIPSNYSTVICQTEERWGKNNYLFSISW